MGVVAVDLLDQPSDCAGDGGVVAAPLRGDDVVRARLAAFGARRFDYVGLLILVAGLSGVTIALMQSTDCG
jgi:hypothetical protein